MIRPRRQPRRFPTSCRLCRSMKLRCNREQPCSNCVTRGVICEKESPSGTPTTPSQLHTSPQPLRRVLNDEEILARLQRLEEIVLPNNATSQRTGLLAGTTQTLHPPAFISEGEGDTKWLEGVGAREASMRSGWSNGVSFQILSIQEALRTDNLGDLRSTSAADAHAAVNIWLPPKSECIWMLNRYTERVESLHHVVHIASVRDLIEDLYNQLSLGFNIKPNYVALVLSIFASTAYMLSSQTTDVHFTNQFNATKCAFVWSKAALNVLEHSNRSTPGSIEDIQAAIILSFVVFNFEGFTMRFRSLNSRALTMARDISLHRIDADVEKSRERPLDLEIKRRVWYHLVSTDWLLALSGGPQEGTYLIQPNHMRVNLPRHIDDADLENDSSCDPPLSRPTSMTYSLLRIRLAEICRTAVDTMPPSFSDWTSLSYDTVISLDKKFEGFLRSLPFFFRLDDASHGKAHEIDMQYPQMAFQRCILASTIHSRRCKLNQPFLTRVSSDSRYQYSRQVCLQSAQAVIRINRQLQNDVVCPDSAHNRLTTLLHTFFLATAVLVMDLCINKSLTTADQRKEAAEACQMLRAAEDTSPVASYFLTSLTAILDKYRVQLSLGSPAPPTNGASAPATGAYNSETNGNFTTSQETMGTDIDMLWRDFIDLDNHNATSWDNLFSNLDARF